jgi:hypothetical protein
MGSSSSKHHLKENCLDPSEVKKKPVIFVLGMYYLPIPLKVTIPYFDHHF